MRHLPVDGLGHADRGEKTCSATTETLGDKVFDDGYDEVADGAVFALSGGDRRIEVHFDKGYPAAQIFAPGDDDVVCFEPMAAPTDALRRGGYGWSTRASPRSRSSGSRWSSRLTDRVDDMADLTPVILRDPSSALSAVYVPGAGMIATSLSDGGNELLGQRRGLDAYVSAGKTIGIPLLYPWANRLSAKTYDVDGETVTLAPDAYGVRPDNNGLPIHGLLAAYPGWQAQQVSDQKLTAELDLGARRNCSRVPVPASGRVDRRAV